MGPSMISGFSRRYFAMFVRTNSAARRTDSSAPAVTICTRARPPRCFPLRASFRLVLFHVLLAFQILVSPSNLIGDDTIRCHALFHRFREYAPCGKEQ